MIIDVTPDDAGLYICSVLRNTSNYESYQDYLHASVRVRTKPGESTNPCLFFSELKLKLFITIRE